MPSPNDITKGTVINRNGDLWLVVSFQRVSPGKGGSFVRTKMKSIKTGKVVEENFKASEPLVFEDVQYKKMQYLYNDGSHYTFMDTVSYEQVAIAKEDLGEDTKYLLENLEVIVVMHGSNALTVQLPIKITYKVALADPAVKGDSSSGNVLKDSEMDNGLKVRVPIFIKPGDEIVVNTDSGEYSERVNK